jgi:hypothetical protein
MNRLTALMSVVVVLGGAMQMSGQRVSSPQQQTRIVVPSSRVMPLGGGSTTLSAISATPSTISFTSTDPDLLTVSGNSAATINWTTSNGSPSQTWTLTVQATSSSFASCSTVPASAVTATCTGVTEGKSGSCSAAFPLSTVAQQVASGKEDNATNAPYTVTLNFTLTDSWSYIANPSCSLTLTYIVTAP